MNDIAPVFLLPATAVAVALIASAVRLVIRFALRDSSRLVEVMAQVFRPTQVLLALGAAHAALTLGRDFEWRPLAAHGLVLGMIAAGAWLTIRLLRLLRVAAEGKLAGGDENDPRLRQRRTQVMVFYRGACALVSLIAVGIMFMTFPGARAVGTSLLASAGVAGVVVGFAAQTMLKNFLAGVNLAFGDTIRLGDVVEIEGEWGRIEDIALSYVVVKIWDERRLVLPSSYFNDMPFRNWSREGTAVMGTVELDVDWRLPVEPARAELRRIAAESRHWDGRRCGLVVSEAVGPLKRLRPMVSAADGDTLWDLRCEVREKLIEWIVANHPDHLPQLRVDSPQRESRITAILPVQSAASENRQASTSS